MKSLADNLNDLLQIDDVPFPQEQHSSPTVAVIPTQSAIIPVDTSVELVTMPESSDGQAESDLQNARKITYDIANKASQAINHLMSVAVATESPRGFEVVNQLIGTLKDAAAQLVDLHVKMETVNEKRRKATDTPNVTNNIQQNIIMTPVELLRKVKKAMEEDPIDVTAQCTVVE